MPASRLFFVEELGTSHAIWVSADTENVNFATLWQAFGIGSHKSH